MHLPIEGIKIPALQKNAVITRTLLQRSNDCITFFKKNPHNVQIRDFLHSLLLFSNSPDVKSKKKKSTEMVKLMHINKKRNTAKLSVPS